jgi:hypothetical protein
MSLFDRSFRLTASDRFGLDCGPDGLSLAGAPLLLRTPNGFAPRPSQDIAALRHPKQGLT